MSTPLSNLAPALAATAGAPARGPAHALQVRLDQLTEGAVSLRFRVDEDTGGRIVVQMVDKQTEEVIRQVPSDEALRIAHEMAERLALMRGTGTGGGR